MSEGDANKVSLEYRNGAPVLPDRLPYTSTRADIIYIRSHFHRTFVLH